MAETVHKKCVFFSVVVTSMLVLYVTLTRWRVFSISVSKHPLLDTAYYTEQNEESLHRQQRDKVLLPPGFNRSKYPYATYSVFGDGRIKEIMTHYDADMHRRKPCPTGRVVVPNFVHWTWLYGRPAPFKFHHYVCALSALRVQKPKRIYMWHDALPSGDTGKNWFPRQSRPV